VRIDLHTHSTASDGTSSPAALVGAAVAARLDVVALTDHDTTAGWAEATDALRTADRDLTLVPGVELSCSVSTGRGPISLHLLAYLFDPVEPQFADARRRLREARTERAAAMVAALQADGHPITEEQVGTIAAGSPIGRPHVAQALVEAGVVRDLNEAFTPEWIGPGGRYRVPRHELSAQDAVGLVQAAGGVSVFAHPYAARRGAVVRAEDIAELAGLGLGGIEAAHPDHLPDEESALRMLAGELGLFVTGSSDWHGGNREQALGARLTDQPDYEQLIAAATGQPTSA
jgi:predicted metal-dependent phosphoesterase TrpH